MADFLESAMKLLEMNINDIEQFMKTLGQVMSKKIEAKGIIYNNRLTEHHGENWADWFGGMIFSYK
jgi:hypothetical protein